MNLERGEVKRLSVAVLVDHRIEVDEEARKLVRVARTAEEMQKFRKLVVAAAGIIEERGDVLTIESLPFTIFEVPLEPPPPPPNPEDNIFSLEWIEKYRYHVIAVGVALVLAVFTVWFALRIKRRVSLMKAEAEAKRRADQEQKEIEAAEEQARLHQAEEAKMLKGLRLATLQSSKAQVLKKHLEEMATEEPESFVQLLRSWIHEDDQ
jgi:flagellar M-ring protein FliF